MRTTQTVTDQRENKTGDNSYNLIENSIFICFLSYL